MLTTMGMVEISYELPHLVFQSHQEFQIYDIKKNHDNPFGCLFGLGIIDPVFFLASCGDTRFEELVGMYSRRLTLFRTKI